MAITPVRYLLDTNIVIYVLKRRPVEVLSTFNANASRMAISSITLAELMHGAEKSSRVSENLSASPALRCHPQRTGKARPTYWGQ